MADLIGHDLGRYHILEQLGEGGMAIVYKAYDTRLERNVAIKVILQQKQHSEKFIKRFEREAKALAQLNHPNIVKVIDYGEHESLPYLVMEYLPGGTLKQKLSGKSIPWQEAVRILLPIVRALSYAHEHKIIHRDVKPSNILITDSGEPMLSDFGIAKILEAEETLDLTGTGVGVGTPEYMSPEQAQGKPVDARSDVYSLGVVLYEMVTGRKPYQADTPMAVVWKLASEPLPRPKQFTRELSDEVDGALIKMLAKDPEQRYQNFNEVAFTLEKLTGTDQSSQSKHQKNRYLRTRWWLMAVLGIGLVLLCGVISLMVAGVYLLPFPGTSMADTVQIISPTPIPSLTNIVSPTTAKTYTETPSTLAYIDCPPDNWFVIGNGTGIWECNGDIIQAHSTLGDSIYATRDVYKDGTLSATLSTINREASLVVRMQDAANGYIVVFLPDGISWNNGVGGIWLVKRINYNEETIGYYHGVGFPKLGEDAYISVKFYATKITVSMEHKDVISVSDSTFSSGVLGIRINGDIQLPCDSTFQNITIEDFN